MPRELLELKLVRNERQPWGFRLHGGRDEGLVLKVEKVTMLFCPLFSWPFETKKHNTHDRSIDGSVLLKTHFKLP